ncbi:hypothetical protein [uncultured Dokdonia sp.]|uniref:hypothetical protein n=1 Tax=uncultured Dokdonia sp. TaxID=575653 RepID=UPI0026074484|nr:hypothetical protein [uncultured Dokdonia sp.]
MKNQFLNFRYVAFSICSMLFLFSCQNDLEESQEEITSSNLVANTTRNTILPDRFQYFHRGRTRDNIYTSHSTTGTSGWSSSTRLNDLGLTKSTVKSAQFFERVAVAYVGRRNTKKIYYGISLDGNRFGPERVVPGAQTNGTFSMLGFDGNLYVYHRGKTSGNSRMFYSVLNGTTFNWSPNRELANSPTYNDFDFIAVDDIFGNQRVYMVAVNNNQLIVKASGNGVNFVDYSTQNIQLPAGTGVPRSISITQNPIDQSGFKHYQIVIRTSTNHIVTTAATIISSTTLNLSNFGTFRKVRVNNIDVKTDNNVSIASNGSNRLVIAYEAESGNNVRYAYSDNFGLNWSGNLNASGSTSASGVDILYLK